MAREKHVTPMTVEEKQNIINDSVQSLSNKPVMSGEDLKKQFVSPIVNADGKANLGDVVSRIAEETEAALNEIDENASTAVQTAENTKTSLGAHVTAYGEHVNNYNAFTEAQKTKDEAQDREVKALQEEKQDNLVIDGGYSESNPVATIQTVENKILPITQDIPLLGATLSMSVDPLTYVLTVELKNKNGEVVSTVNSDLPLEEMVVDARLGEDEQTIVLELKNGNSVSFSVAALVDGLISKEAFEEALGGKADKLSGANMLLGTDENGNQKEYSVNSVGTNVYVGGERVETFNTDEKADKEATETALEERVKTETVGVAGGVAGLDEQGKVPKSQLPDAALGLTIGETYDTAFAGDRGVKLEKRVDTLYKFHEEAGDIIITPIATPFNTRTTADGANVVEGSLAVLKKVEGNSVASKNLFDISVINITENIDTTQITKVEENLIEIQTPTGYSGNGYTNTGKALKKACPFLRVGETVYLNFDSTATTSGTNRIFFAGVGLWENGTAKTVTEAMLSSGIVLYCEPTPNTVTKIINFRITKEQNAPWQPYFTGVKSASFKGIESKDVDGNVISMLELPESVSTPLGTTIDFENKKITNYGVEIVLTGTETVEYRWGGSTYGNGVQIVGILPTVESYAKYVCSDSGNLHVGASTAGNKTVIWHDLLDNLGFTTAGTQPTTEEQATAITNFKAWLAERYDAGNPVTIRYISSELQSETPFTDAQLDVGDNYTVSPQGTETVLGNDGEEYGAETTPTIEYVVKAGE